MKNFKMIVAADQNRVIGINNTIPWKCRADMKRFKRLTMGGAVLMGRLTFESMRSKPLLGRHNIVAAQNLPWNDDVVRTSNVEHFVTEEFPYLFKPSTPLWFIGGSRIYEEGLRFCDEIYVTEIVGEVETKPGDLIAKLPTFDESPWDCYVLTPTNAQATLNNGTKVPVRFLKYERR